MFNVISEQVLHYTGQSAINIDHNHMVNKYRLREMGPRHVRQRYRGTMPHLICLSISRLWLLQGSAGYREQGNLRLIEMIHKGKLLAVWRLKITSLVLQVYCKCTVHNLWVDQVGLYVDIEAKNDKNENCRTSNLMCRSPSIIQGTNKAQWGKLWYQNKVTKTWIISLCDIENGMKNAMFTFVFLIVLRHSDNDLLI